MLADTDIATPAEASDEVIAGRYELVDEIGRGGQALTFLARDRQTDEHVVLKELDLRRAGDWKAVELFEREGQVLRSLDHPAIPKLLNAFVEEDEAGRRARLFSAQSPFSWRWWWCPTCSRA